MEQGQQEALKPDASTSKPIPQRNHAGTRQEASPRKGTDQARSPTLAMAQHASIDPHYKWGCTPEEGSSSWQQQWTERPDHCGTTNSTAPHLTACCWSPTPAGFPESSESRLAHLTLASSPAPGHPPGMEAHMARKRARLTKERGR